MSHGTADWHRETIQRLRHLSLERTTPLAILVDLAGPKIRVGDLPEEGKVLTPGRDVILVPLLGFPHQTSSANGWVDTLPVGLSRFPDGMKVGQIVLIDDGNISLTVEKQEAEGLICRVLVGGKVTSHKGVNFPGLPLDIPGFTQKDEDDLQVAIEEQVDYVALLLCEGQKISEPSKQLLMKDRQAFPSLPKSRGLKP